MSLRVEAVISSDSAERRLRREVLVEFVVETVPELPFDLKVARVHARLWADLLAIGHAIGAHDLIIAATAMANESAVMTTNLRDFERVPALEVRQSTW